MFTRPTRSRLTAAAFCAVFALAGSSAAMAATQGSPGTTSSGSVTINASIAARVAISNLTDVTFADTDLAPVLGAGTSAQKTESVCVWSNNADRGYFITATGSGTSNAFTLASGANPVVPYSVAWNQLTAQTTGTALTAATKSAKFTSTAVLTNCGGGASATLLVSILGTDASTMLAGAAYTGTLTLLVSPT
jgi:hypothetical protein